MQRLCVYRWRSYTTRPATLCTCMFDVSRELLSCKKLQYSGSGSCVMWNRRHVHSRITLYGEF